MTQKTDDTLVKPICAEQTELTDSIEVLNKVGKSILAGDLVLSSAVEPAGDRLPLWLNTKPIETLETIASRLKMLMENNVQLADELLPISNQLIGLRQDMADLFEEIKRDKLPRPAV